MSRTISAMSAAHPPAYWAVSSRSRKSSDSPGKIVGALGISWPGWKPKPGCGSEPVYSREAMMRSPSAVCFRRRTWNVKEVGEPRRCDILCEVRVEHGLHQAVPRSDDRIREGS